jgi:hypothetical protein
VGQVFASVNSATPEQLVVTLPSGASFSGALVVTTPSGTANGPDVFTAPAPLVGGSFPVAMRLTSGQQQSVTLAGPSDTALLIIDGHAKQRMSLTSATARLATGP